MKVEKIVVGNLEENCYILSIKDKCIVIDPGDEQELIKSKIGDKQVLKVLITHKHFDHIGALYDIINTYNIDYMDFTNTLEKEYKIADFNFKVICNPGHTKDSVTYYFYDYNIMFTGDFIFKGLLEEQI